MTNLLDLITPNNLEAAKEDFFANSSSSPRFHYFWEDQINEPRFSIKLKYPLWNAIKIQDHNLITKSASDLFEVQISDSIVKHATTIATIKGKNSRGTPEKFVILMRKALNEFDLQDISVVLTDTPGFNIRPQHDQKQLIVSQQIHFEYFSMEGEVNHELVHALRYRNGKHNQVKRSQRFLPTEEGLASWCQDHTNDDNGAAQHAMEYVASSVGLRGSLRDIYNCLRELGMSKELSWKRSCRHKFGFVDTSQPGDILKPAMYFANEEKIAKLSTAEKLRLLVGKISLDELPDHPAYTGLWPADKLIKYFKL